MKKLLTICVLGLCVLLGGVGQVFATAQSDATAALQNYNALVTKGEELQKELEGWEKSLDEYVKLTEYYGENNIGTGTSSQGSSFWGSWIDSVMDNTANYYVGNTTPVGDDLEEMRVKGLNLVAENIARVKREIEQNKEDQETAKVILDAKKKLAEIENAGSAAGENQDATTSNIKTPEIGLDTTLLSGGTLIEDNTTIRENLVIFVREFIPAVGNYVAVVVAALAVLFVIIGGFRYLTAMGNEEKAAKGKLTVVMALVALLLIVFAYTIVSIIVNFAAFRQPAPEPMPEIVTRGCAGDQDYVDLYEKSVSDSDQILSFKDNTQVGNLVDVECETTMENVSLDLAKYDTYDCVWQGSTTAAVDSKKAEDGQKVANQDALKLAIASLLAINVESSTTVSTNTESGQSATDKISTSVNEKISGVSYTTINKQEHVDENGDFTYGDYTIKVNFKAYYPTGEKGESFGSGKNYCKKVN